jgi:lincosamide nucleotidyltransferase B/F
MPTLARSVGGEFCEVRYEARLSVHTDPYRRCIHTRFRLSSKPTCDEAGKGTLAVSGVSRAMINRFVRVCHSDVRVAAAFLGGSHVAGTDDEYSDLDLYLVVRDEHYETFFAERQAFMGRLGDPVFLEDFSDFGFDMVVFIFSDGVEGELALGRTPRFDHIHSGPFKTLVDKEGILERVVFPSHRPTEEAQTSTLRWLLYWFWRDLSELSRALARGRLWTAHGLLEELRLKCVNLARLKHDFSSAWVVGYEKLEQAADARDLEALRSAFCPPEREAMLEAVRTVVEFYLWAAPPLATQHGIAYPANLEAVVTEKLKRRCGLRLDDGTAEE